MDPFDSGPVKTFLLTAPVAWVLNIWATFYSSQSLWLQVRMLLSYFLFVSRQPRVGIIFEPQVLKLVRSDAMQSWCNIFYWAVFWGYPSKLAGFCGHPTILETWGSWVEILPDFSQIKCLIITWQLKYASRWLVQDLKNWSIASWTQRLRIKICH